jgi:DNA-binding Lrp family transcriptional regulator
MAPMPQTFNHLDHALLTEIQRQVPVDHRPFELLGRKLDISEQECLRRLEPLRQQGVIQHIGASFNAEALGYDVTLAAMRVAAEHVDQAAAAAGQYPGTAFVCTRNDPFNVWVALAVPPEDTVDRVLGVLQTLAKSQETVRLPLARLYKRSDVPDPADTIPPIQGLEEPSEELRRQKMRLRLSEEDLRFIRILQDDLPLIEMPFAVLAEQAGASEDELFAWIRQARHAGSVSRFAATVRPKTPQALGSILIAWQIPMESVEQVGEHMARVREVSRCEQRAVHPSWPYSLLSTIRVHTAADGMGVVGRIERQIGRFTHKHLFILKEYQRVRPPLFSPALNEWWTQVGWPTLRGAQGSLT